MAVRLRVFTKPALVLLVLLPRDIPGVHVRQEYPLFSRLLSESVASIRFPARVRPPEDEGPGVPRIVQHLQCTAVRQLRPQQIAFVRPFLQAAGKQKALLTECLDRRHRRSGAAEGLKEKPQSLLNL